MVQITTSTTSNIQDILQQQRQFFSTGKTRDVAFRLAQLKTLKQVILDNQAAILMALKADLHKSGFESYATEIGVVGEIKYAIKHLRTWVKTKTVAVPAQLFPGRAKIYPEPVGVVLIIAPWNYPVYLVIAPLVGAIAAGNCAVLKPSELAPETSHVLAEIIGKIFDPAYIAIVEGGVETSQSLLDEKFDHIFFTGGTAIGKVVMAAAAKHLTPVTLELGGKSPCVVDADIQVEQTAKRIVWGKFLNAGQTCVAPDYLLVNQRIKRDLLQAIASTIHDFYGDDPAQSQDYGRIINQHHFSRLTKLLQDGRILVGGKTNPDDRYIAPTVVDQVSLDDRIMQDEIFGPILPVLEYSNLEEAIALINSKPKPLALYVFSQDQRIQARLLRETSSGSVCINDTIMQAGVPALPFGGVGDSGIGSYHGKAGFDNFSHRKSILYKPFWFNMPLLYPPYADKLNLLQKIFR
jgi:acyl-CoA reductase-like NAD-dependent aldehyde dehydrogenase